jgi:EAL domain-containing protein (putative c-di-GMP-specific phosphodiesterase class I)
VHVFPVWTHPEHETVWGPELFTLAERIGRGPELQSWLLREAARATAALPDDGIGMALSLRTESLPTEGLPAAVADALATSGLDPSRLVLCFTEDTLLTASASFLPELEAVRRTGVRLCLDNYGMGQSLFALLARVSVDMVRVDVAGLAGRDDTTRALQVLGAIVRTTGSFDLTTIAGGIGTPELRDAVYAAGVHLVHGRSQPGDYLTPDAIAAAAVPA